MSKAAPVVWIVKTDRMGTNNELRGVAERLGAAQIVEIDIAKPQSDKSSFNLVRQAAGCTSVKENEVHTQAGRLRLVEEVKAKGLSPDIVLLTQSQVSYLAEYFRKNFPDSFVVWFGGRGSRESMRDNGYAHCFVNYGDAKSTISPVGVGHRITPELLQSAKERWAPTFEPYPHPRIGVFIGGDVDHIYEETHLTPQDTAKLGENLCRVADQHGGSLLITTSGRTPPEAADALKKAVADYKNVFFYDPKDPSNTIPNPIHGIMASADILVPTADSVSMMSEACSTGKPVYIYDQVGSRTAASAGVAEGLIEGNHAKRFDNALQEGWKPDPINITQQIADEIQQRIEKSASFSRAQA